MSSLKDAAAELHLLSQSHGENNNSMSVTPPVAHVEMWPYVASAAVGFESHAATAVLMLLSVITLLMVGCGVGRCVVGSCVGRGEDVGRGVGLDVGRGDGRGVGLGGGIAGTRYGAGPAQHGAGRDARRVLAPI